MSDSKVDLAVILNCTEEVEVSFAILHSDGYTESLRGWITKTVIQSGAFTY